MLKINQMWRVTIGLLLLCVVAGCSQSADNLVAAPLGDRAVLEQLADAYTEVSDKTLGVSPMKLLGDERHAFLTEVFARAGYDYSATLRALAMGGFDRGNQLHNDMVDLV